MKKLAFLAFLLFAPIAGALAQFNGCPPGFCPGNLLGGAGNTPVLWTPLNLGSALAAWWDAGNASKIVLNGSTVASWTDTKSGIVAAQATGANQPGYSSSGVIGTGPGLGFSGAAQFLATPAYTQSGTWGVFSIVAPQPGGTIHSIFDADGVVSPRIAQYLRYNGATGNLESIQFTSVTNYSATEAVASATPSLVYAETPSGLLQTYVNGVAGTATATSGTGVGGSHISTIGISADQSSSSFVGEIGDIVQVNRSLTTSERWKLEGYEGWKYGLQALLPSSNPYSPTGSLHRAPYVSDP